MADIARAAGTDRARTTTAVAYGDSSDVSSASSTDQPQLSDTALAVFPEAPVTM